VGAIANLVAAIELYSIGCTLIGPVDGDLHLGIKDNSLLPSSFNGSSTGALLVNTSTSVVISNLTV
jgi:hypothetical protein